MADGKVTIETEVDSKGAEQGVSKLGAGLKKVGSVAGAGLKAVQSDKLVNLVSVLGQASDKINN